MFMPNKAYCCSTDVIKKKNISAEAHILLGKSNPKKIICKIIWLLIKSLGKKKGYLDWVSGLKTGHKGGL